MIRLIKRYLIQTYFKAIPLKCPVTLKAHLKEKGTEADEKGNNKITVELLQSQTMCVVPPILGYEM